MAAADAPREVRKVVTVLFCDLTGSTELGARTDPEALRATMRSYYDEMRRILERHGGTVEKFVGDAVMAVFGVPVAHEDDALRAVRAAWEMREAVPALGLTARIGVNTGEVVAGEGDTLVTGDAVNVAARLEQAAEPGQVLVGAETRRLVRDAVECEAVSVEAKGKGAVGAFRLTAVDLEAAAVARRLDTPLVGRKRELDVLRQAAERSLRESSCHLFTLLGPAGVGKSRLVAEFLGGVDAQVVRGRCLDYGDGITFWPVVEVLKQLGPRTEPTIDRLAAGAGSPNELFFSIRRLLEDVARERPLVVEFDDIHWGEPTFLDLIDHIADLSRGAPILLLCIARPELLDERPGWGGGKLNATTVLLEPLTDDETARLVEELDGSIDAATREHILRFAGGNPLFAEEMLALARDGGDIGIPSTIHALLQARLDRLGTDERAVIERGAVEGQVFHRSAVRELSPAAVRDSVEQNLVGLVRKELIRPDQPTFPDDDAFRFRHLLIRDAAYESLPKETRADLHERFGDWLERNVALVELDEIVGYHLEQAVIYRRELGRDDEQLAERAGSHLARAGQGALGRSDLHAARNLLNRAVELLPPGREWAQSSLQLGHAMYDSGDVSEALERVSDLESDPDSSIRTHARLLAAFIRINVAPHGAREQAHALLEEVVPELERDGDDLGLAQAWLLDAQAHWIGSRAEPTLQSARRALHHARRARDARMIAEAAATMAPAASWGPADRAEQAAIVEELTALGEQNVLTPLLTRLRGWNAAADADYDLATALVDEFEAAAEALGHETLRSSADGVRAVMAFWQGRFEEALAYAERSYQAMVDVGSTSVASTQAVNLAVALHLNGRPDEADEMAIYGEQLGSADDVINIALGRGVRACVAADRGDVKRARELADDALAAALKTDFPYAHGEAYRTLAYVHGAAGESDLQRERLEQAREAFSRKPIVGLVDQVDKALAELTPR
jgi:class 3 adenylate cyclase/tetratricopeptide (TPR) repeat protein